LKKPRDLIEHYTDSKTLEAGTLMFCGTPAALNGIYPGTRFEMEISDPIIGRSLTHGYEIDILPVVS
jgi:2-keto-4-pentenoate hydratase/2-oxohepta-3-ene-1,7-dioic acid hydratase in catechol pathway